VATTLSNHSESIKVLENDSIIVKGDGENSAVLKGGGNIANGVGSISLGIGSTADGKYSFASGNSVASGDYSHSEGVAAVENGVTRYTKAIGKASHAEGEGCHASATGAHAEGMWTDARKNGSHAEGYKTVADGQYSHAEGNESQTIGNISHAEGKNCIAKGRASHAEGWYTIANNEGEHASGKYNVSNGDTQFSIGIGTADNNRKNAFEVKKNGDIYIEGVGGRIQDKLNEISQINKTIEDNEEVIAAALSELDEKVGGITGNNNAVQSIDFINGFIGQSGYNSPLIINSGGGSTPINILGSELELSGRATFRGEAYFIENVQFYKKASSTGGFYETSDETLKNFGEDVAIDLDKIAQLPKKYFSWKDDENNQLNIGTSAQAVKELYPELVSEDKDGKLMVNYAKLSVIALKAIDVLNDEMKRMKNDIDIIKKKLDL
jgi:hypothetical protein